MPSINTIYKGNMLFESQIGNHVVTIDVPDAMGGEDRGPTPPQLFVASLGSCIAAFVAQYCERVGIDDTGMSVTLNFENAEDPKRLVDLKATVNLPNGECGKRINAIESVSEHCPVHATIKETTGVDIEIIGKS